MLGDKPDGAEWGAIWGGVSPRQPTRRSGERRELPQWGPGNAFSVYSRPHSDAQPIDSVVFL